MLLDYSSSGSAIRPEDRIRLPRRPSLQRRRAIKHAMRRRRAIKYAMRLLNAISDGRGRICWWLLEEQLSSTKIMRILKRIKAADRSIAQALENMLSACMEEPI